MPDPIAPITADIRAIVPVAPGPKSADDVRFMDTLKSALAEVERTQRAAEEAARTYATGQTADVTATMLTMERAAVTLQLMLQVRARLLDAYQEIQRMQV
jgi:flagellar hook-basal body complex protein FliE